MVQNITAHFHGANPRLTVGTDSSVNIVSQIQPLAVADLLEQIKPHLAGLPEPVKTQIAEPIRIAEDEIRSGTPDHPKLHAALQSARSVAEGAAGNLVAAGIAGMIGRMLAG